MTKAMTSGNTVTTRELLNLHVVDGRKNKRIGKVRRFVFHPNAKRCIGLLVKRPDAALMFHRKDLFVALGGFDIDDEGRVVVHDDPAATDRGALKALGVDWDACVIWVGLPVMTADGESLGYVDTVTFDRESGAVRSMSVENGAANDAIVGKRVIPASYVKGFKRGQGVPLVVTDGHRGEGLELEGECGAIVVAAEALELPITGGVAAAAGRATAVVADKAKEGAVKAKKAAAEKVEAAKPGAQKFAEKAGNAVESGSYAVGKQLGKASGMFAAFKEEFDKASRGEDEGN